MVDPAMQPNAKTFSPDTASVRNCSCRSFAAASVCTGGPVTGAVRERVREATANGSRAGERRRSKIRTEFSLGSVWNKDSMMRN